VTPVKSAPVRSSGPTPVEHPEGARFNRAGGVNSAVFYEEFNWAGKIRKQRLEGSPPH